MRLAWLNRLTKQIGRKSREKVCGAPDPTRSGSSGGGGGGGSSSSCNSSTRTVCAVGQARGGTARSGSTSSYSCSGRVTSVQQHPAGADRRGSREAATPAPAQAAALKDVRVIQRCLVYVIGIPPSIAKKEVSFEGFPCLSLGFGVASLQMLSCGGLWQYACLGEAYPRSPPKTTSR